jgi:TonB-linked SusC/RagA family outer membrane protein
MKNYNNILRMNWSPVLIKTVGLLLLFALCFSTNELSAAQNNSNNAANNSVSGIVRDAHTKKPIVAAQIKVLNDNASATTNESGAFKLKIKSKNALLSVSAFYYGVRQVSIQGKDSLIIELYKDDFSSYYHEINGDNGLIDNLTSVSTIKGASNINHSTAISADEILQSELGGDVRAISRSGVAGMGASLFIRGLNSINANAQPLFVVDGVIWNNLYNVTSIHEGFFSNPLANIDVNDIESISVLKDGVSIYGSKAANGVVLIKTKRGNGMVTKISLNVVSGVTSTPKTIPVMSVDDYKVYVTNMIGSAGLTNSELAQLPFLNDNPARVTYKTYHNNTNWTDEVYQTGLSKSYSINVNGGDEKALYYLTLGYTGNKGVVKTTNMDRYNLRLNADINLASFVSLGVNVGFSRIDRVLVDDGVNSYTSPTWLSLTKSPFLSPYGFTSLGVKTSEPTYADIFAVGNPVGILQYANNTLKQNNFNVTLKPTFRISSALTLSEQFDYNLNKTNEDYYRPYLYTSPITINGVGESYNARMSQVMRNNAIFSDTRLNFVKQFDANNKLTAFLGSRYVFNYYESDYVEGHNSMSNSSINLMGAFKYLHTNGVNNYTKSLSHYLNVDYSLKNRYLLSVAMSVDGSSRFGNETTGGLSLFGHSWGVFPSVNGAWLISSEKFMANVPVINTLKLRVGYGITGNDDIKDYQTQAYFASVRYGNVYNGMILSNIGNPQIQWETTGRANLGLDMGLLNDRLSLSVDVYSSNTKNLLVLKHFQDIAGLDTYWSNEGEMTNKGIELSTNAKLLNLSKLHWELGFSIGHYVNNITKLPNGEFTTPVYGGEVLSREGNAAGVFYGYKTHGVYATEAEVVNSGLKVLNSNGTYSAFGAGDVIFEDVSGKDGVKDGVIDAYDKQVIGNPNPDFYGTINNKFTYKNITLSALFTYSYGNQIYNYQRSQLEAGADYSNQSLSMKSRWTSEGQVTSQPKAVYGDPMGNSRFSDRWIEDGSYIRLKTLSLSYNLPIKSTFIEGVNIWVSANNIFTVTHYLGADPEFSSQNSVLFQGVDAGLVPMSRSYYVGLKLNL